MIALSIILGVACAILLVLLSSQDNKNTKLAVENSLLKGRMEGLQEKLAQQAPDADEPLILCSVSITWTPKSGRWIFSITQRM